MKNLYYLSYNNYYNRIAKREETIADYLSVATLCGAVATANFNPNDGIATQVTPYLSAVQGSPDYVVVANEDGTIHSRWWVIETRYNTGKTQFILSLYRDVIAEWQNEILNAPCYVEKGYTTRDDPSILLNETIETNQIKMNQWQLKDKSKSRWIVGYIPKTDVGGSESMIFSTSWGAPYMVEEYTTAEDCPFYDQIDVWNQTSASNFKISVQYAFTGYASSYAPADGIAMYFSLDGDDISRTEPFTEATALNYFSTDLEVGYGYKTGDLLAQGIPPSIPVSSYIPPELLTKTLGESIPKEEILETDNYFKSYYSNSKLDIAQYENQYIKIAGVAYKVCRETDSFTFTSTGNNLYPLIYYINKLFHRNIEINGQTLSFGEFGEQNLRQVQLVITAERERFYLNSFDPNFAVDLNQNRSQCEDSPYDIFCFPYDHGVKVKSDDKVYDVDSVFSLTVASAMADHLGSSNVYDIQLLPYCPIPQVITSDGTVDARGWPTTYVKHASSGIPLMAIFWCPASSGSFSIDFDYELPTNPYDFKIANQCDFMRLSGPNDGSSFDFSPTKNRGVSRFNVTYTYKPFQPYIHIAPEFGGLYNKTYKWEKRGLILRGDFSIAKTSSAWAEFKSQNANYQDVFNRQIDNMEVTQSAEKWSTWGSMATGSLTGVASGAMLGSVVPGIGTAIGGALGGIASLVGGGIDVGQTYKLQNEAIDYAYDQFNMSLQAIKARPDTLTKISAFDIDCSPFPMLEYYSCSYDEKLAIRNKLKYNGMTIMKIGKLVDYIDPTDELTYIKGKLIRLEKLQEDYHMINTISAEMNMGVFI